MKWSQNFIYTLKEAPADAEITSHRLMIRAGLIKKLAPGLHTYGNIALRALRKFENIIRQELDSRGCIEILMPMVQPQSIWEETGRWDKMGAGLLKFKNRNDHGFCLGATHEEAVTDYIRHDIKSYRDLPKNLYQIQTKYRDEIRPRFGLMRGREFLMKDAYSFDLNQVEAIKSYEMMFEAYKAIFDRLGVQYRTVQADAGAIGGSRTNEFQLLTEAGEDALLVSETSDFAANVEICPAIDFEPHIQAGTPLPIEKFATPGMKKISSLSKGLNIPERDLVKSLFYAVNESAVRGSKHELQAICVLLRGSDEINPVKLKNVLGLSDDPRMLDDDEVFKTTGAHPGSCGPIGLKIPIYMDTGVQGFKNYVVGANADGFHIKNVNHGRDFETTKIADLRLAKQGDKDPMSDGKLKSYRGIEVGHVFYLGPLYAQKMNAAYLDKEGKSQTIEMGCYGIGVSRTIQAVIEQCHDNDGIIWPKAIAPFHVHICCLDINDAKIIEVQDAIEKQLIARGIEVFIDDRDERPGVKFKDADLLGFPVRIVLGRKGLDKGEIEVVDRKTKVISKVNVEDVAPAVAKILFM